MEGREQPFGRDAKVHDTWKFPPGDDPWKSRTWGFSAYCMPAMMQLARVRDGLSDSRRTFSARSADRPMACAASPPAMILKLIFQDLTPIQIRVPDLFAY